MNGKPSWLKDLQENGNRYPAPKIFKDLTVPDDWDTLEDFVEWYMTNGMPNRIPAETGVIVTDDANAICLFRHKRFQVEMYLVHPGYSVTNHSHPGVEVILVQLGGQNEPMPSPKIVANNWGATTPKLERGAFHGGDLSGNKKTHSDSPGYAMLAFEHWEEGTKMTSAAVQWDGVSAGPLQEKLVRKHFPNAFIGDGRIDVTIDISKEKP